MDEIRIFENPVFGKIRTAGTSDEPLFCATDVCRALGYSNGRDAIAKHCESRDVAKCDTPTKNQFGTVVQQLMTYVNESGLYALILGSKLESAREFKHWVTSDVLPSIRKHGVYMVDDVLRKVIENPDFLIGIATELKAEKEARELAERNAAEKQKQIELQAPKVDFYDRVTKSDSMFDMNEVSKVLKYDRIGRNNLFKILREKGILNADNQPYQKFVAQGYFKLVEDRKIIKGKECVFPQTVVFQKGVDFINRILKEYESENKDKSNQLNLF